MKVTHKCGHEIDHPGMPTDSDTLQRFKQSLCKNCQKETNLAVLAVGPNATIYSCGHRKKGIGTGPEVRSPKPCKACRAQRSQQKYLDNLALRGKKVATAIYDCGCHIKVELKRGAPDIVRRSGACPYHNMAFNRMGGIGDYCHQDNDEGRDD